MYQARLILRGLHLAWVVLGASWYPSLFSCPGPSSLCKQLTEPKSLKQLMGALLTQAGAQATGGEEADFAQQILC